MNTRSCLLTVGVSALLATGSVITAAPASAAPGSAECVSAQSALNAQLGVASVDISLANSLRSAIERYNGASADAEAAFYAAFAQAEDEERVMAAAEEAAQLAYDAWLAADEALVAAVAAEQAASDEVIAAKARLDAVPDGDEEARLAAEADLTAAQEAERAAETIVLSRVQEESDAEELYNTAEQAAAVAFDAFDMAIQTPEFVAAQEAVATAYRSFEEAMIAIGATPGIDPRSLTGLADAAVAACSAPAVANIPALTVSAPQQRGLNIQTAAHDTGATDPANLALLAGLAGFGTAAAAGAVVVVRRRSAGRA